MFLFSKKFLLFLVAVALLFGGERQLAKALKCYKCRGLNGICDVYHTGSSEDCSDSGACAMLKSKNRISKYCENDYVVWEDVANDGKPKCSMSECYCITDNCNKSKNFGMPGGSGGTGEGGSTTVADGAIGTRSITSVAVAMITVAVAMMAVGPAVVIAQCF